jgi:hypothetical protein
MSNFFETLIILHFKTNQHSKKYKKQKIDNLSVIETSWLKFNIKTKEKSDSKTIAIIPNSKKNISKDFEIVNHFSESLELFDEFIQKEKSKFIILSENSWHIDKCCSKEIFLKKKELPNYFTQFFDLRKEFSKVHELNLNLFKMLDFLELKSGVLLSASEYCESISNIVIKLLEQGFNFQKIYFSHRTLF